MVGTRACPETRSVSHGQANGKGGQRKGEGKRMEMEEKKKEEGKEAEKKEKSTGTGKQNSSSTAQRPAQRLAGTHVKHKHKQMQK